MLNLFIEDNGQARAIVRWRNYFAGKGALWVLLVLLSSLLGAVPGRAAGKQTFVHRVPVDVSTMMPLARLARTRHLALAISLPLRNQPALADLLRQISDPSSPNYRHYLTPTEFTERFGPSESDYAAVVKFAKSHGLRVTGMHPNRTILDVEGAVAEVENIFHVRMSIYQHPKEARHFYAPNTDPSVELGVTLLGVSGLDNYSLPQPRYQLGARNAKAALSTSHSTTSEGSATPNGLGSGPNGQYMGDDFRTAYVPGVTLTGAGETVGLVQFDGYTTSDITYYENLARRNVTLTNVLLDGFDGTPTHGGGEIEVSLDIEMVMSLAPGVSNIIVYEAGPSGDWHDMLNRIANDNLAKQVSCSWYSPDGPADPTADQIFQQMAAQGQSFFSASGDYDAFTGLIPFPGDTPYITEVGGTMLTTNGAGGAYTSEAAWNRNNGIGSGGGISTQYAIPTWQKGLAVTANLGSTTKRNVPDVALTADNVYVRADGVDYIVGGTSCAAPLWAAFTALVNQQAVVNSGSTVGFLNPAIYAIGKGTTYTSAFHDMTVGNNFSPSSPAKFPAVTGYDLCTGWGSPNGAEMITDLTGPPAPIITTTSPLPFGVVGTSYGQTLAARAGTPPYAWSISDGSLPAGLGLSPAGVISGTPTAASTASFTLQVTDSRGFSSTAPFTLLVSPLGTPVISTTSPLPTGIAGAVYSQTLSAIGGTLPLTWTLASGSLPLGLNLSSGGTISGTAGGVGTSSFTVQVTDQQGLSSTADFSLAIGIPPTFATGSPLPSGVLNTAYSQALTATGGISPYTFTLISGSLPQGMSLGGAGLISGIPTAAGTANFGVQVTDGEGLSATTSFSITIAPSGPLDHFAWSIIPSPQTVGSPFPATITAQDAGNNTVVTFTGTANLSAGVPQTLLNSPAPQYNYNYGTYTLGYSFTPSTNIEVTAVRSYSGTKVSIWTDAGQLVASVPLNATPGSWIDTPLQTPLQLQAGVTYRIGFLTGGATYYGRTDMPSTFPNGTLNGGYETSGDGFPTSPNSWKWILVDLKYVAGGSIAVSPGTTEAFSSGIWSGNISVAQPGSALSLSAGDGAGHYGYSNGFAATSGADLAVSPGSGPLASGPGGGPFNPGSTTYTVSNTGTGSMNWTASNMSPWLSVAPADGTLGPGASTTVTATINSAANGLATGSYSDTINFSNTTSGFGNTSCAASLTVLAAPPVITSALTATGNTGAAFSYQITAANNPTSYSASGLPTGLSVNTTTGAISGTPTVPGTFNVSISATGAGGTSSATLVITITGPPTPIITSSLNATATLATAFAYQITAANGPTSYGVEGLPPGLALDPVTGAISGTPTNTGLYGVTISATNSGGTGSATLTISVAEQSPPVITSILAASGTLATPFSYQITASNNPTSFNASGLPSGLSVNTTTGAISGTPQGTGTFNATISATNLGGPGSAILVITIGVPAPVINVAFQSIKEFTAPSSGGGAYPLSSMVQGSDGNLYGTTANGGNDNDGTVFKITPGGTYSALCSFTGTDGNGVQPRAGLVQGSDGNFYGTTTGDGDTQTACGLGTVFKITRTGVLTNLCAFRGTNGSMPQTVLIQGYDGNFYGTTSGGGSSNCGTIFKMTPAGVLTTLYSFTQASGNDPFAGLIQQTDGSFYGATVRGGINGAGTVFKLTPDGVFTTVYAFDGGSGGPASFIQGRDGNFYGTGATGYGTIFKMTPSGSLTTLGSFSPAVGTGPNTLVQGSDGNFYGTAGGGSTNNGIVYELTASGSLSAIFTFNFFNGSNPCGSTLGSDGNFYGTTSSGGTNYGTLFKLTPFFATVALGQLVTYQVTATNTPTSYAATDLPTGVTINTTTGLISGKPTVTGTFIANVSATNSGGAGSNNVTITVLPPAPVITSPLTETISAGVPFSYQITATNNPTRYNAVGLPVGVGVNPLTGLISGTPTTGSANSVTISASNGAVGSAVLTIAVTQPPTITNGPPPFATLNTAYHFTYTSGGYPVSAYSITSGSLPPGLTLSSAGVFSGTPTAAGIYPMQVTATNAFGADTQNFNLIVEPPTPPTFTNGPPPPPTIDVPYSFAFAVEGYPSPTFTLTSGTLPSGLNLSSAGVISGTPSVGSTHVITVTAQNGVGTAATQTVTLVVQQPPEIIGSVPPSAPLNKAYSFKFTFLGNPAPTISVISGTLPPGLTLTPAGVLSGTPTVAGTYPVTVDATDGASPDAMLSFSILVGTPPVITNGTPPPSTVFSSYNFVFTASGVPASYFQLASGMIPNGLTLSTTGVLSGTPTTAGTYPITINAQNGIGSGVSQSYSLVCIGAVAPPAPTGLAVSPGDGQVTLTWNAVTNATSYNVKRTTLFGTYTTVASPTGTDVVDIGLTNGTTYYYEVTAVDSAGESNPRPWGARGHCLRLPPRRLV